MIRGRYILKTLLNKRSQLPNTTIYDFTHMKVHSRRIHTDKVGQWLLRAGGAGQTGAIS